MSFLLAVLFELPAEPTDSPVLDGADHTRQVVVHSPSQDSDSEEEYITPLTSLYSTVPPETQAQNDAIIPLNRESAITPGETSSSLGTEHEVTQSAASHEVELSGSMQGSLQYSAQTSVQSSRAESTLESPSDAAAEESIARQPEGDAPSISPQSSSNARVFQKQISDDPQRR